MKLDKYKLEYEMKSRGISIEMLCNAVNISRSAFYRKCNGLSEFTQGEIQKIVDYLGLRSPMGIFLLIKYPKRHNISQRIYYTQLLTRLHEVSKKEERWKRY